MQSTTIRVTLDPVRFDREAHMIWWYEIRNEPSVRAVSRSRKKIKADEHKAWWQASAALATRKLYFIRRHDGVHEPQVVGFARLDDRGGWTEVSIALVPEWRGQKIGSTAIRSLLVEAANIGFPPVGAVINAQNQASLALFFRAGFVLKRKGFVQVMVPTKKPTRRPL